MVSATNTSCCDVLCGVPIFLVNFDRFFIFYYKEREVNFDRLLDPRDPTERVNFINNGRLHDLIHADGSLPAGFMQRSTDPNEVVRVYDNFIHTYTYRLLSEIESTFSFVPQPIKLQMELDYFVRSALLVKHYFIWNPLLLEESANVVNQMHLGTVDYQLRSVICISLLFY